MNPSPIDIAVIPVAGRGTGLLPLTKSQPKEMLPVGRKPVVQYVVEEMHHCGLRRMLFVTGPGKAAIENHFDIDRELIDFLRTSGREELLQELAFEREAVEYLYTRQRRQLGLGHAVLCARAVVGDKPFVVALGDSILGLQRPSGVVARMIEAFDQTGADAVLALEEVPAADVVHYGIAQPRSENDRWCELDDVVEKPAVDQAPSRLSLAARYVFSPRVLDFLENTPPGIDGQIQLTDAIRALIADGGRVLGIRLEAGERRYDIGDYPSFYRAVLASALGDAQIGPSLRQYVRELLAGESDRTTHRQTHTPDGS